MGLFDKKYCVHCGKKLGIIINGGKSLEDGHLCKDCCSLLSPWFTERKHSTTADIEEQLKYREANKNAVAAFNTTHSYGENTKLLLDDYQKRFTITSAANLVNANPDILDYSQITNYRTEIREGKTEIRQHNPQGPDTSYNPPRYKASYDFYVTVNVNNPYFNEMRFRLNNSTVYVDPTLIPIRTFGMGQPRPTMTQPQPVPAPRPGMPPQPGYQRPMPGAMNPQRPGVPPQPGYQRPMPGAMNPQRPGVPPQPGYQHPTPAPQPAPAPQPMEPQFRCEKTDPMTNSNYVRYYNMIQDIDAVLAAITSQGQSMAAEQYTSAAPSGPVTCPYCGGTMIPENNCCIYCGKKIC